MFASTQIRPATARDPAVGVGGIDRVDNNIQAGAKYLRHLIDQYFDDPAVPELRGAGLGGCEASGADCGLLGGTGALVLLAVEGRVAGTAGAGGGGTRRAGWGRGAGRAAGM